MLTYIKAISDDHRHSPESSDILQTISWLCRNFQGHWDTHRILLLLEIFNTKLFLLMKILFYEILYTSVEKTKRFFAMFSQNVMWLSQLLSNVIDRSEKMYSIVQLQVVLIKIAVQLLNHVLTFSWRHIKKHQAIEIGCDGMSHHLRPDVACERDWMWIDDEIVTMFGNVVHCRQHVVETWWSIRLKRARDDDCIGENFDDLRKAVKQRQSDDLLHWSDFIFMSTFAPFDRIDNANLKTTLVVCHRIDEIMSIMKTRNKIKHLIVALSDCI